MSANQLIRNNILFLRQGVELLERLNDELYIKTVAPYFSSGVGKHIRHDLDHYESFLSGLAAGKIDYGKCASSSKTSIPAFSNQESAPRRDFSCRLSLQP